MYFKLHIYHFYSVECEFFRFSSKYTFSSKVCIVFSCLLNLFGLLDMLAVSHTSDSCDAIDYPKFMWNILRSERSLCGRLLQALTIQVALREKLCSITPMNERLFCGAILFFNVHWRRCEANISRMLFHNSSITPRIST